MMKMRLIRLVTNSRKYIVQTILWQWIALLFHMLAIASIAILLQQLWDGSVDERAIGITAVIALLSMGVRFLCNKRAVRASFFASTELKTVLREKIYEKLLSLGISYREKTVTSEVVQLAVEGVEQLEIYFGKYIPQLFYSILAPLTLFLILSFVNLRASMVLLLCVPLIPISIVAVQKVAKKLLNKYWGVYTELGDSFLENLQGLTTLKIYQADQKKAEEMDKEAETFRRITMKVLTMQLNSISVMDIVAYGGAAVGMLITLQEYRNGRVGFAGAIAIILLAAEFFIPLRLLGSFFHIAMNGMSASDKIFHLLDLEQSPLGEKELKKEQNDIVFSDVSFQYDEDREILKQISFCIPKGSFAALVGKSGCGKSTIAGILIGRKKGASGKITIGGVNINEVSEESLMKEITLVSHNSYLFKGTIEDNLRMGNPNVKEKEMIQALTEVNLWAYLKSQNGLLTELTEAAGNLSGGQRQRLALARALLHDSSIYVFDEATSNIDAESEEMIMRVIKGLKRKKTVLVISHRLANVVEADQIYVMKQGTIWETGNHLELLKKKGLYADLYINQKNLEQYGSDDRKGGLWWNAEVE